MTQLLYRNRFRVPSARRPGWDYRWNGTYAVTVCVRGRVCCLGEVVDGEVGLSPFGEVVAAEWRRIPEIHSRVTLDEWIVMPDHLHGILLFGGGRGSSPTLGTVVGQFKQRSTKQIRTQRYPEFAWQERFYDQILNSLDALERYRDYLRGNPLRWQPPVVAPAPPVP